MKTEKSLSHLFISATRRKLIKVLFYAPDDVFYVRQLVRLVNEEINSVRRELQNLKDVSLIKSEKRGNRLYYWPNQQSSLFPILLTLANKTAGLGLALSAQKNSGGKVKMLAYSHHFATNQKPTTDEIDLIIVGPLSPQKIEKYIKQEEKERHREINYMVMGKKELQLRKQKRDPFIVDFFLNCPLIIIGSPKDMANV